VLIKDEKYPAVNQGRSRYGKPPRSLARLHWEFILT
jgi:hypothetical protein